MCGGGGLCIGMGSLRGSRVCAKYIFLCAFMSILREYVSKNSGTPCLYIIVVQ